MKLAEYLEVNPIALAVTVGLMREDKVGVARLELPRETKMLGYVEDQINKIRGLDNETRTALIRTARERFQAA